LTDEINEGDRKKGGPGVVEKSANTETGLGYFSSLSIGIGVDIHGNIWALSLSANRI
jgi:hypothetical protein